MLTYRCLYLVTSIWNIQNSLQFLKFIIRLSIHSIYEQIHARLSFFALGFLLYFIHLGVFLIAQLLLWLPKWCAHLPYFYVVSSLLVAWFRNIAASKTLLSFYEVFSAGSRFLCMCVCVCVCLSVFISPSINTQ